MPKNKTMKNIRKLSREDKKKISAGDLSPAFCIEGGSPGTGGCSAGHICSGGRCIPYVDPGNGGGGSGGEETPILVSVPGERLPNRHPVRNLIV